MLARNQKHRIFMTQVMTHLEMVSKGGRARAEKLTPEQRKQISSLGGHAKSKNPKATHIGELQIGDLKIECAVLQDGTRVISRKSMLELLGRNPTSGTKGCARNGPFVTAKNLIPFIDSVLVDRARMIKFKHPKSGIAHGYQAELIPSICKVYLEARRAKQLSPKQEHIAQRAEIIVQSLAQIGIVALVDEATGYELAKEHQALQKLFAAYIAEELQPWVKRFPTQFFENVKKIYGLTQEANRLPQFVGNFINKYIYEELSPEILEELKKINPSEDGKRKNRHHQFLTNSIGCPALEKQIVKINTLMQLSSNKEEFDLLYDKLKPKSQLEFNI